MDDDETADFLSRAEAALLDDTPALFPPTTYSERLVGNLPSWWSTHCDHSPRRLSAWTALTAAHQLLSDERDVLRACITDALSACELIEERQISTNLRAVAERMASWQLSIRATCRAQS
ncbi:hypothetical protein ACFYOI_36390 [Streptomyces microflavus]|uniref:hypothetical protein n=1 Tax=Streptomyces microflavus TaxID=1919 RepID=UPI0033B499A6